LDALRALSVGADDAPEALKTVAGGKRGTSAATG
jgi:hypothetical protein